LGQIIQMTGACDSEFSPAVCEASPSHDLSPNTISPEVLRG